MTSGILGYRHGVPILQGRCHVLIPFAVHSLFLGSFVLEPDLNTSDFQSRLLGHLFPHQAGGSGGLGENSHHNFHLILGKLGSGHPFFVAFIGTVGVRVGRA